MKRRNKISQSTSIQEQLISFFLRNYGTFLLRYLSTPVIIRETERSSDYQWGADIDDFLYRHILVEVDTYFNNDEYTNAWLQVADRVKEMPIYTTLKKAIEAANRRWVIASGDYAKIKILEEEDANDKKPKEIEPPVIIIEEVKKLKQNDTDKI